MGWELHRVTNSLSHSWPLFQIAKYGHRLLLPGIKYIWKCSAIDNIIHSTACFLVFLSIIFLFFSSLFHKSNSFRRDFSYNKSITSNMQRKKFLGMNRKEKRVKHRTAQIRKQDLCLRTFPLQQSKTSVLAVTLSHVVCLFSMLFLHCS